MLGPLLLEMRSQPSTGGIYKILGQLQHTNRNAFGNQLEERAPSTQVQTRNQIRELDPNGVKTFEGGCAFLLNWYNNLKGQLQPQQQQPLQPQRQHQPLPPEEPQPPQLVQPQQHPPPPPEQPQQQEQTQQLQNQQVLPGRRRRRNRSANITQARLRTLLQPLSPANRRQVQDALSSVGDANEALSVLGSDSVKRLHFRTLNDTIWLDDCIINFYLKHCLRIRDEDLHRRLQRKRSHFFNSFFIQTMFDLKNANPLLRKVYNYDNVQNWGSNRDIFKLKHIFCPINIDNFHWTVIVIFMEEKRVCYYDSMGGTDDVLLHGVLQYLNDEHLHKKHRPLDPGWSVERCPATCPRQLNGFDCGVFVCMICDFISSDCELTFNQDHINRCREKMALAILDQCAIE